MFRTRHKGGRNGALASIQEERAQLLSGASGFFVREAYNSLRTNVIFSLTEEEDCKIVAVTSAMQEEGKSLTAANLAIAFAEADKRVLLVDCDLRRPKVSRLFGLNAEVGLTNLLLDSTLRNKAVLSSDQKGLSVLLSGDIPPNPSELLGSERMKRLLNELRKDFDYIVLDTPPVNMVTDMSVLAPQVDGVLFVVRIGASEKRAVRHAVLQLEYAKAKLLGFVLNGTENSTRRGYRKYRRYGYYGYAHTAHSALDQADGSVGKS